MKLPLACTGSTIPRTSPRRRAGGWSTLCRGLAVTIGLGAPAVASAQTPPAPPTQVKQAPPAPQAQARTTAVEFSSLRLLHEKGVISKDEYERALRDLGQSSGLRAADNMTLVLGSVSTTLYGFIEMHAMYDSTQSFGDSPNNAQVARSNTYAAEHSRLQFSVRDSRLGFRFKGPDITPSVHTSANLEMDFFAPLPTGVTESATFDNSPLRIRHAYFKLETPIVDLIIGQYWDLFGWQPLFVAPSVQFSGVPANLFGRTAQLRLSKTVKLGGVTLESAVAGLRPPQRDSSVPEGQIGLRLSLDNWTAVQTIYSSTTLVSPASIAVTGDVRGFAVKDFSAAPTHDNTAFGKGIAVGLFLPILPGTKEKKGNSLAIQGEFATGEGIADLYTGLVGGVDNAALPPPGPDMPAPAFAPNIDPGIAVYDSSGKLHLVQWTTFIVGAQYTLPGLDGKVFTAVNFARSMSSNAKDLNADPKKVREKEDWFDACLWVDPVKPLRFGIEYSYFSDTYADGERATNHRGNVNAFWFF